MPVNANHPRPISPAASDDAGPNRKDKGYRRYASNVERALSLFDTALQEWADYIAFLGRLLKALQSKPPGTAEIPHKAVVAKRLAQCLDPVLPSGVHQKALEVYAYVFALLDKDGLSRDLTLYLPGLAPTLSFASLSVKPALLSLFEVYIVPLDPLMLRAALKAIVLALLPGLEEETSEEFARSHNLLNRLKNAVRQGKTKHNPPSDVSGDQYFWQNLFLASITSSSRRQGALAYLVRELPRLSAHVASDPKPKRWGNVEKNGSTEDLPHEIEAVASPEPGLLVRCFAAGLQDEQLLIQRGFLDLLVTHLPLHSAVLHLKVVPRDLELLVMAAASVVARREMSLNKRLWTWFLGPGASAEVDDSIPESPVSPGSSGITTPANGHRLSPTEYFEQYGLKVLINGIKKSFANDSLMPAEKARPFRICLSLMDRWEIGGLVAPRVFLPAMESVWRYQKTNPHNEALSEVLRSAIVFFDGVESSLIWAELIQILYRALEVKDPKLEKAMVSKPDGQLGLVLFVITNFNIRDEEMLAFHIPMATLVVLISLRLRLEKISDQSREEESDTVQTGFKIAIQLLDVIPDRVFSLDSPAQTPHPTLSENENSTYQNRQILERVQRFYGWLQRRSEDVDPPIKNKDIRDLLLHNAIQIVIQVGYFERGLLFLDKLIRKSPCLDGEDQEQLMSSLLESSYDVATHDRGSSKFPAVAALVSALETISNAASPDAWASDHRVRHILPNLISSLWAYISPSRPRHNVEAIRCIWRIYSISPDSQLVEGTIATLMFQEETGHRGQHLQIEAAHRFTTLWAHSSSTTNSASDRRSSLSRSTRKSTGRPGKINNEPVIIARPLLLLLDALFHPKTELFLFTVSWLQSLSSIQNIIDFLVHRLRATAYLAEKPSNPTATNDSDADDATNDVEECFYYLQTVSNLVQYSQTNVWASLASRMDSATFGGSQQSEKADVIEPAKTSSDDEVPGKTVQDYLMQVCMRILEQHNLKQSRPGHETSAVRQTCVSLLQQMLLGPPSAIPLGMELDGSLIKTLNWSVEQSDLLLQEPLMNLILIVLKAQMIKKDPIITPQRRPTSRETIRSTSQASLSTERSEKDRASTWQLTPTPALLESLMFGISSPNSHPILEHWVRFLGGCLPLYTGNAFQIIMPLVDCFVKSIESVFQGVRATFEGTVSAGSPMTSEPITTLNALFNGLEQVLARGHDQLTQDEAQSASVKSPEQIQGFFGNMVSGVFASEAQKSRSATANNHLTVLLCFKDAVRVSFNMWSWGDAGLGGLSRDTTTSASFNYTSLRLRNRTRRILEHLFAAEALECTETLVEFWHGADSRDGTAQSSSVFNLLHTLEGSRPKNTIPALFNAIYSRTNPNVLDPMRKSTLTSDLSDVSLARFLNVYTRSMEDDALDEIWADCMTFLRDVLSNPLPHRQTLPLLLEFTAFLGEKIDNTNFGDQQKMRRDLGDLFVRLLAATFTIKPLAFSQDLFTSSSDEQSNHDSVNEVDTRKATASDDVVNIIASILPKISKILGNTDRVSAATTTISTQILLPTFRGKSFPRNVTASTLDILMTMSRMPEALKTWRKDVADAFNDPRFFHAGSIDYAESGWMPVLRQLALLDKDRMPDLLSRLLPPTTAGIVFGVGATSARIEADRKAQLNLRRVAFLMLSAENDTFVVNLNGLQEKLVDLMTATVASSPSSTTRAEVYMVLRALILKTSPIHLASFWPVINTELYDVMSSLNPAGAHGTYNIPCVLQAAKLLDILLTIAPDDFQLREWLFITDTIDAVYRPSGWKPVALVDGLAESLDTKASAVHSANTPSINNTQQGMRKPLLTWNTIKDVPKESMIDRILRPFLRQVSINAFESTYRMEAPDRKACCEDLLRDLFDDFTFV